MEKNLFVFVILAIYHYYQNNESLHNQLPGLIDDRGLKVDEDSSWHVLPISSLGYNQSIMCAAFDNSAAHLREERGKGVVASCLVRGHVTVRLQQVLSLNHNLDDCSSFQHVHRFSSRQCLLCIVITWMPCSRQ